MGLIRRFRQKFQNSLRIRQVITLYMANIIGIPVMIVTSVILTRYLGPSSYGDYKFLANLFNLVIVFFTFGLFQAGNRALVLNNSPEKARKLYGAELVILAILFLVMAIFLMGYAFFDHNIGEKGLRRILIWLIPFSWTFLLTRYCEVLFQADNRINLLASSRLLPQVLFALLILPLYLYFRNDTENKQAIIWVLYLLAHISVLLYIIYKVNPLFDDLRQNLNEIWSFNKSYGFDVYVGTAFAVGFSQLTGIIISYFSENNAGVGFYSLAVTISLPLSFIPNVIATTHYKDFSTAIKIPRRLFLTTILLSGSALILTLLVVGPFVKIFYGIQFLPVISLTYIVSFGVVLSGMADFFNRFLGSHGKGKALRNSSIIVGLSLLVFNFTLIPAFGETGAAYTRVVSGLVYILCMYWFYRRELTGNRDKKL